MNAVSLTCNHCGAPLQVAESTRFVTCRHCGSRLAIKHAAGAAYTEVLDEIRSTQREMVDDLETIRLQNELARIDREWLERRSAFETIQKDGRRRLPSTGNTVGVVIVAVIVSVLILAWISAASEAGGWFPVFGLLALVAVAIGVVRTFRDASRYSTAERQHRRRRRKILTELARRGARQEDGLT